MDLRSGKKGRFTADSIASTSKVKIEDDNNDDAELECAVCLQTCMHPVRLPCSHIFCFLCVKGVANQSKKCAMCRQEIPADFLDHPILLKKLNEAEQEKEGFQWFYEGRNGWWQYDERTSIDLEAAYTEGIKLYEVLVAGFLYTIDFERMIQQRRNDPSRRRRIKRDLIANTEKKGIAGLKTFSHNPTESTSGYDDTNTRIATDDASSFQISVPNDSEDSNFRASSDDTGIPIIIQTDGNSRLPHINDLTVRTSRINNSPSITSSHGTNRSSNFTSVDPSGIIEDASFLSNPSSSSSPGRLNDGCNRGGRRPNIRRIRYDLDEENIEGDQSPRPVLAISERITNLVRSLNVLDLSAEDTDEEESEEYLLPFEDHSSS